jgi:hypothetical protein
VGKTIRFKVTATNASGSGNASSAATAAVTAAVPANSAVPAITGTAKDGQTLTSSTGTWTGTTPLTYIRKWRRCDTAGANCTDISGATATTYVLAAVDVGKTIRVVLTASNTAGNAAATSTATATVTAAAPANTALPMITGTAKEGQLLSASTGSWTGSMTIAYSYQWQSCSSSGTSCTAISGATLSTYRLAATNVTKTVKVVVTATNATGSASATSAASAAITTGPPVSTTAPALTGTAKDGQTLTTANGTWAGTATITYTRQWKRCNSSGASCTTISGATGTTYILVAADVGSTVKVTWTATNSLGSATADTATTAVVTAAPPTNTTPPAITGTAKDGQTLTSTTGTWTGSATITYTRTWKRCDNAVANCTTISGATGTTYVPTGSDVGSTIKVTVTATNSSGSATADSTATVLITGTAPANTALPTITGTTKDGQTLTSTTGTWTGSATITYARQWQRCNSSGSSCTAITGATGTTYALTATDVAKRIRVAVTATNTAGNATATSAATAIVLASPPANTTAPTITGTVKEGWIVYATSGTWSGSGAFNYTYQWQHCDATGANCADIDGATFDGYEISHEDLGLTIRATVTASNSAGSATATTATSAPITTSAPVVQRNADVALDPGTLPFGDTDLTIPIWGATFGQVEASWYGTKPVTTTFQWMRCDPAGDNCTDLPGATAKRYKTVRDDNNKTLRIRITATNSVGSTTVTTDPGRLITDGAPTNTEPPTLNGAQRNHYTLTVQNGSWTGPLPVTSTTYQWMRCDAAAENCDVIPDRDPYDPEYQLSDIDVGHRLKVITLPHTSKPETVAGMATEPTAIISAGSTRPVVSLGGSLVVDPDQWLDGDSYTLTVSATAGADTNGLASVAVLYGGEQLAAYDGCSGASCSISEELDVDLSEKEDGASALLVVATDKDRTETVERREVHIDRGAPRPPQRVLVDMAADGSTMLTWQASNSPDTAGYEILRRNSPEEPFSVIATTDDAFFLDPGAGQTAPLARMTAARFAVAENALTGEDHVEYQVQAKDLAGEVSSPTATVEASATDEPVPAPTEVQVEQTSETAPTQLTWDPAPGAHRYAVFRSLDLVADLTSPATGQAKGTPELIADVPAEVADLTDTPEVSGHYTYTIRSVTGGGQLGDSSPETSVDLQATKIPMSQDALDYAPQITAALEAGGAPSRPRMACDAVCDKLRGAAIALPGAGYSADKVAEQLYKLGATVKALPDPGLLTKAAGRATAVGTAFTVGWEIGTYIRKTYLTLEDVPPPTAEIANWKLAYGNGVASNWLCGYNWEGSACIGNGHFYIEGKILTPGFGAVGLNADNQPIDINSWTTACSSPDKPDPQATMPGGWRWLMQVGPCPFMWGRSSFHWVPFHRGRLGPPMPGVDGPSVGDGTPIKPGQPAPTEAEAIQLLIDALRDHPDQYAALIPWLELQLGQTPTATADGTPFCGDKTYEACVSAFQHAGFAGPFTKKILDPDEAWIGKPGGAVIDTTPWADDRPDDFGPVEIEVNPDQMPDWTQQDEQIDQNIKNINPVPDNEFLMDSVRQNVARQCRLWVQRAGLPTSNCWSLPIMVTGGLDARGPALNDVLALVRHPRWVGLNNRGKVPRKSPPWYFNRSDPSPGCVRNPVGPGQSAPPSGMECDEYPMWGMAQAYEGDLQTDIPNIAWVPKRENGRQGNVYWQFVNNFAPGDSMLFHGCNIPPTTVPSPLTPAQRDAVPPTFLAIPVPARLMPSFGICNHNP